MKKKIRVLPLTQDNIPCLLLFPEEKYHGAQIYFSSVPPIFTQVISAGDLTHLLFSTSELTNIRCVVMPCVNNHMPVFDNNITNCL